MHGERPVRGDAWRRSPPFVSSSDRVLGAARWPVKWSKRRMDTSKIIRLEPVHIVKRNGNAAVSRPGAAT